ncbi:hypothetical protein ABPG77_007451 [Micractinium sp. CCAP 211/92]
MSASKILICATNGTKLLDGRPTGCWAEEVGSPYLLWRQKGFTVDLASVSGGEIPWDQASLEGDFFTPEAQAFMKDEHALKAMKATPSAEEVLAQGIDSYDALFIPGGHGIVFDGTGDALRSLVEAFWSAGKVVSSVCHGPAGLTTAKDANGDSILKGRQCTGFSNSEERAVGKDKAVPFLLEDRMKELGGAYTAGPDWQPHAVADSKLITGQNPGSSKRVAELVIEALGSGLKEPVHGKGPHEGFHRRPKEVTSQHHDHHDERPRQGARHDEPDPSKARSSWHQSYRPPI